MQLHQLCAEKLCEASGCIYNLGTFFVDDGLCSDSSLYELAWYYVYDRGDYEYGEYGYPTVISASCMCWTASPTTEPTLDPSNNPTESSTIMPTYDPTVEYSSISNGDHVLPSLSISEHFAYTGLPQYLVVPASVTELTVTLTGASGGNSVACLLYTSDAADE